MVRAVLMTDQELGAVGASEREGGFGGLQTERGHLPLKAMSIDARLTGLIATLELEQTFVNVMDEPIEATYVFPLPDRAAVTQFTMTVGARRIDGVLKERGEARREYTAAIQQGHRAAITEEDRSGVFTMRVGNLMPGDIAVVRLALTGPLPSADGEATFRFPLVVAPRYIPGRALPGASAGSGTAHDTDAVPDASRITPPVLLPGFPNPVRLSLAVHLDPAGLPLSDVRSSLHTVTESVDASGTLHLRVQPGERLNRDFILRYRVGDGRLASSLLVEPDATGSGGTFLLTVVPPPRAAGGQARPRDVVFVLDRSGSMEGWKMVAARRAIGRMLDTLRDGDRFTVIAFDDQLEWPAGFAAGQLIDASDRHRFRALEWLATVGARGGTEMARPLEQGGRLLAAGGGYRDRVLVLATDGQVGDEDRILRDLAPHLTGVRVFSVGIDRAVNGAFLERLGKLGGGGWELVESEDRLDASMDRVHRRIGAPVLTELRVVGEGLAVDASSLVPARLPDVFTGVPVQIAGRYAGGAGGALAVYGADASGQRHTEVLRGRVIGGRAASQHWARGRVRELEDRFAIGQGDRGALEQQIVSTSLTFGVLSRFTAFVAVDRAEVVNAGGALHEVVQPVESPEGWGSAGSPPPPPAKMAARGPIGQTRAGAMPDAWMSTPSGAPLPSRARAAAAPMSPSPALMPQAARAMDEDLELAGDDGAAMEYEEAQAQVVAPAPAPERRMEAKKKGGLLGRLFAKSDAAPAGGVPDAERSLIAKLLVSTQDALAAARDDDARRRALEALWMALEGVLDRLRRQGAPLAGLLELHQRLGAAFASAGPIDVDALWKDARTVMAAAAGMAPPSTPAESSFWKR